MEANKNKIGGRKVDDSGLKPEFLLEAFKNSDIKFGIWANVAGKPMNIRKITFNDDYKSSLPHQQRAICLIMRYFWTSFDSISGLENQEKSDDITVGGVVLNRLYKYPETVRALMKWHMRRILSVNECLEEIPYPDPNLAVQAEPVACIYKLPPYVFITDNDENKVGVWDEKSQTWMTDYIEDLNYNKGTRELVFNTRKFAPFAYLQSKCTDFPYDSWYLRCIADQVALLTIQTKRITVNIEIHPLFVKLVDMEWAEFKHLKN